MKQESSSGITSERIHRTNMEYIRLVRYGTGVDASVAPGIRMRFVIRLEGVVEIVSIYEWKQRSFVQAICSVNNSKLIKLG